MAAIDIRSLNPNQLPGAAGDPSLDPSLAGTAGTSATPTAAHLGAVRNLVAVDGVSAASPSHTVGQAGAANTAAPVLPDAVGPQGTPQAAAKMLANTTAFDVNVGGPISTAEMFNILQKSAMTGYMLSSVINRAANMTSIDAKKSEANHLITQVQGEREHAAVTFGASVLAAVATIGVPIVGSRWAKGKSSADPDPNTPTPPAAGTPGAPGGSGAATTSHVTPPAAPVVGRAANPAAPNGKAPDPSAPSTVPGTPAGNANPMAGKGKARQRASSLPHTNAQGGPSGSGNPPAPPSVTATSPAGPSGTTIPPVGASGSTTPPAAPHAAGAPAGNPGQPGAQNGALQGQDPTKSISPEEQARIDRGNAYTQAGPAVGTTITSGFDLIDKTSGGQYKADEAKIAQKQDAIDAQVAELAKDSSKSGQDQALEVLKAAQQLTQSYSQRWTEVNNNIANR